MVHHGTNAKGVPANCDDAEKFLNTPRERTPLGKRLET